MEELDDHRLAAWLAQSAGQLLLPLRGGPLQGAASGLAGDAAANAFLISALSSLRPDDAILSEESPDSGARLSARRVWIIDPLDGTREYGQGRGDWAVHVALAVDGVPLAGAVAQPDRGRCFATGSVAAPPPSDRRPIMLVSRTRPPAQAEALAGHLGAELREMGSAGAKAMAVVAGEADLYYHAGGQHEWDNCAPVAVALAAGLKASRADGSPIVYNQADVRVPDLIIGTADLAAKAISFFTARAGQG
ncbi:MAG TPA: 3'(2'),5'-bisphosphate nucleotidase CysQ [Allosphingosinicella sp.]